MATPDLNPLHEKLQEYLGPNISVRKVSMNSNSEVVVKIRVPGLDKPLVIETGDARVLEYIKNPIEEIHLQEWFNQYIKSGLSKFQDPEAALKSIEYRPEEKKVIVRTQGEPKAFEFSYIHEETLKLQQMTSDREIKRLEKKIVKREKPQGIKVLVPETVRTKEASQLREKLEKQKQLQMAAKVALFVLEEGELITLPNMVEYIRPRMNINEYLKTATLTQLRDFDLEKLSDEELKNLPLDQLSFEQFSNLDFSKVLDKIPLKKLDQDKLIILIKKIDDLSFLKRLDKKSLGQLCKALNINEFDDNKIREIIKLFPNEVLTKSQWRDYVVEHRIEIDFRKVSTDISLNLALLEVERHQDYSGVLHLLHFGGFEDIKVLEAFRQKPDFVMAEIVYLLKLNVALTLRNGHLAISDKDYKDELALGYILSHLDLFERKSSPDKSATDEIIHLFEKRMPWLKFNLDAFPELNEIFKTIYTRIQRSYIDPPPSWSAVTHDFKSRYEDVKDYSVFPLLALNGDFLRFLDNYSGSAETALEQFAIGGLWYFRAPGMTEIEPGVPRKANDVLTAPNVDTQAIEFLKLSLKELQANPNSDYAKNALMLTKIFVTRNLLKKDDPLVLEMIRQIQDILFKDDVDWGKKSVWFDLRSKEDVQKIIRNIQDHQVSYFEIEDLNQSSSGLVSPVLISLVPNVALSSSLVKSVASIEEFFDKSEVNEELMSGLKTIYSYFESQKTVTDYIHAVSGQKTGSNTHKKEIEFTNWLSRKAMIYLLGYKAGVKVEPGETKARLKEIKTRAIKIINLVDKLVEEGNIQAAMSLSSALNNSGVQRIIGKFIEDGEFSRGVLNKYRKFNELFEPRPAYKNLREYTESLIKQGKFVLPFYGMQATDLTMGSDGASKVMIDPANDRLLYNNFKALYKIINNYLKTKTHFNGDGTQAMENILAKIKTLPFSEDIIYDHSMKVLPRNPPS